MWTPHQRSACLIANHILGPNTKSCTSQHRTTMHPIPLCNRYCTGKKLSGRFWVRSSWGRRRFGHDLRVYRTTACVESLTHFHLLTLLDLLLPWRMGQRCTDDAWFPEQGLQRRLPCHARSYWRSQRWSLPRPEIRLQPAEMGSEGHVRGTYLPITSFYWLPYRCIIHTSGPDVHQKCGPRRWFFRVIFTQTSRWCWHSLPSSSRTHIVI